MNKRINYLIFDIQYILIKYKTDPIPLISQCIIVKIIHLSKEKLKTDAYIERN